jgi:hypothetical protein
LERIEACRIVVCRYEAHNGADSVNTSNSTACVIAGNPLWS